MDWVRVTFPGKEVPYRVGYDKLVDKDGHWNQDLLRRMWQEKVELACMCKVTPVPMHVRKRPTKHGVHYALVSNPQGGAHDRACPRFAVRGFHGTHNLSRTSGEDRKANETHLEAELELAEEQRRITSLPTLDKLNPQQRRAAMHGEGPCLVVAAAGSGKTSTIIRRIKYLVQEREQRVKPWKILATTFTKKATAEMRSRIAVELGAEGKKVSIGTLHSVGNRMLKGVLSKEWTMLENPYYAIEMAMDRPSDYNPHGTGISMNPVKALEGIAILKGSAIRPGEEPEHVSDELRELFKAYEAIKDDRKWLDYEDLILKPCDLFEDDEFAEKWRNQWDYVIVDEFQDTNLAQWMLVRNLVQTHGNLMVVGDDWQAIYGWRGGRVGLMKEFLNVYDDAKHVVLDVNYRSRPNIIHVCAPVIALNGEHQIKKDVKAAQDASEDMYIDAIKYLTDTVEARQVVAEELKELHEDYPDVPWSEYAILCRTHIQSRPFEEVLLEEDIPYEVVGSSHFYENTDVQTILGYLRTAMDPSNSQVWVKLLNKPKRYISKRVIQEVEAGGWSACAAHPKCRSFVVAIEHIQTLMDNPADAIRWLVDSQPGMIRQQDEDEPIKWVESLIQSAMRYNSIEGFVAFVDWAVKKSKEPKQDAVKIMTVHAAKGLEFNTVFVVGLAEGIFPHKKALQDEVQMQEETRLCYVAMSRAKEKLFLTMARKYGDTELELEPSRFFEVAQRANEEYAGQREI